ncbi:MAG: ribbon-helix-helix protein, CopG family [bacterium]
MGKSPSANSQPPDALNPVFLTMSRIHVIIISNFVSMELFNMVRTQVQLTEKQAELIKKLAKQKGVSMAEIVRQGINAIFEEEKAIITEKNKNVHLLQ